MRAACRQVTGALLLLVGVLATFALPGTAVAHSDLVGGTPAPGAVVDTSVTTVTLTFESEVAPALAHVVVSSPRRADHVVGEPAVIGEQVQVRVDELDRPGNYDVRYRIVAADGHPVVGSYSFTVAPEATALPAATVPAVAAPPLPAATPPGPARGVVLVVAALGLVVALSLVVRHRSAG